MVGLLYGVIGFTEILPIVFAARAPRPNGGGRRDSQVDRGDLDVVMENFGDRVSSGLDSLKYGQCEMAVLWIGCL